jgi:hypothetical protein
MAKQTTPDPNPKNSESVVDVIEGVANSIADVQNELRHLVGQTCDISQELKHIDAGISDLNRSLLLVAAGLLLQQDAAASLQMKERVRELLEQEFLS